MRKLLLISFFFVFSYTNAQSTIDIIRASNLYEKAVRSYSAGNYKGALATLKETESNLKGKTNSDLEFLKIMTYYQLKEFEKSYELVTTYFEEGFSDRYVGFRNIETYNKTYDIKYDEKLTEIFVDLEDKNTLVTSVSADDVIGSIVDRINREKKTFGQSYEDFTYENVTVSNYWQTSTNEFQPGRGMYASYQDHEVNVRFQRNDYSTTGSDLRSQYQYLYYTSDLYCERVNLRFKETSTVDKYSYRYSFNLIEKETRITSRNNCPQTATYGGESFSSRVKKKKFSDESYSERISFTEEERLILERGDNLQKLQQELKRKGLLKS